MFSPLTFNINQILADELPNITLGDKIKKLRVSLGLTQLQFAKSINMGFGTVTKWEQNITTPKPDALNKIISIHNLPSSYFDI